MACKAIDLKGRPFSICSHASWNSTQSFISICSLLSGMLTKKLISLFTANMISVFFFEISDNFFVVCLDFLICYCCGLAVLRTGVFDLSFGGGLFCSSSSSASLWLVDMRPFTVSYFFNLNVLRFLRMYMKSGSLDLLVIASSLIYCFSCSRLSL